MTEGPRAGWYSDAQGELRYWDGSAWTDYTARNYPYATNAQQSAGFTADAHRVNKSWLRRWEVWLVAGCVAVLGIVAVGAAATTVTTDTATSQPAVATEPAQPVDQTPSSEPSPATEPTPTPEPTDEPVVMLLITDQKDGDSWVASDGNEYRLGLVNAPERNEQCGPEAAAFTRKLLANGFSVNAYANDTHGRVVAEVRDAKGRSLNVMLAKRGLADDRYLEEFRHENPELGRRLDRAFASASVPACRKAVKPVPLVPQPRKTKAPDKDCMAGYSPCLPIVADLDCGEIGHPVRVTGSDPYRLDRDGDGTGCD
ncbi:MULTISPECIES: thermonuclease family protein [unclassified Aeromicrobium]|uniref:thermonuclease family protein n=1 Tax=unclassified Aeromicrobium TaxID=2633570 RepID=UPI00396B05B0